MGDVVMEEDVEETLEEIERKASDSDDPEGYKLRLMGKLERSIKNDREYREG